jgi:hypothetical protein
MKKFFKTALIWCVCGVAFLCAPAHASSTYYFDATAPTGLTGAPAPLFVAANTTSGFWSGGNPYATSLFLFPAGEFQPGDTLNFGTLTLFTSGVFCNQLERCSVSGGYYDLHFPGPTNYSVSDAVILEPTVITPCSVLDFSCATAADAPPLIVPLLFTVGTGETDIQMAWAYGTYSSGNGEVVPIPATLPLFATGIGGLLGLLGWRRSLFKK